MTKRKLSHQQSRRIAQNQQRRSRQASEQPQGSGIDEHGLVIARFSKQADIEAADGKVWRCHLRANLGDIVTGDRVVWQQHDESSGVIVSVEPCRNRLQRPDSYGKMRAVAANIDQVLITLAPEPEPHTGLIDRYLVAAENLGVTPVLLVNKSDLLSSENEHPIEKQLIHYRNIGYNVIRASAKTASGMDQLKHVLKSKISIFAGQSGVGKSSLIQQLLPGEDIKIGELSEQVAKGRHTTTHSRLYHFPDGGDCIDSPGIREFGLWHLNKDEVIQGFVELKPLAGQCKFRDCNHEQEPGCAINTAVEKGQISAERFSSFRRIIGSLDDVDIKTF